LGDSSLLPIYRALISPIHSMSYCCCCCCCFRLICRKHNYLLNIV
jgi:hypothetical protein